MTSWCLLGLGTPLRRDDGIGIRILKEIQKSAHEAIKGVDCIDGGTGGFSLLHLISQYEVVIVLDAVYYGGKPGQVHLFSEDEIKSVKEPCWSSTHGLDFLDVLRMAREIDTKPKTVYVIGIQPYTVSTGNSLSPVIEQQLTHILNTVLSMLQQIRTDHKNNQEGNS